MNKMFVWSMSMLLVLLAGCSSQDSVDEVWTPVTLSGLKDAYALHVGQEITLTPRLEESAGMQCRWLLDGTEVSGETSYTYRATDAKIHQLLFRLITEQGKQEQIIRMGGIQPQSIELQTTVCQPVQLSADVWGDAPTMAWDSVSTASSLYRLVDGKPWGSVFVAVRAGQYSFYRWTEETVWEVIVKVTEPDKKPTPYIARVLDYSPAPGQFVNTMPRYEEGDTKADMTRKAGEWLAKEDANMITLGGWGGSVTIGFDHTIVNVAGLRDFRINGNAFGAASNLRPNAPFGGSCEPGIILVAYDQNKNGKPDEEEWYEIQGSANVSAEKEPWYSIAVEKKMDTKVYRDYRMTYYRPVKEEPEEQGMPDNPLAYVSIQNYIRWEDNQQHAGYKVKNVYHNQSYYPQWETGDHLTFTGICLPNNGINEGDFNPGINQGGVYYVLYGFRYGYVDNAPNMDDNSAIDIDWAVDKQGNRVHLPGVDFIKIYNGINQECGWLGETSTEVERGEDLHLLGKQIATINE